MAKGEWVNRLRSIDPDAILLMAESNVLDAVTPYDRVTKKEQLQAEIFKDSFIALRNQLEQLQAHALSL